MPPAPSPTSPPRRARSAGWRLGPGRGRRRSNPAFGGRVHGAGEERHGARTRLPGPSRVEPGRHRGVGHLLDPDHRKMRTFAATSPFCRWRRNPPVCSEKTAPCARRTRCGTSARSVRASRSTMSATVRPDSSSARLAPGLGPDRLGALGGPLAARGGREPPVDRLDDLQDRHLGRRAAERVSALDPSLALEDPGPGGARRTAAPGSGGGSPRLRDLQDRNRRRRPALGQLRQRQNRRAALLGDGDQDGSRKPRGLRSLAHEPRQSRSGPAIPPSAGGSRGPRGARGARCPRRAARGAGSSARGGRSTRRGRRP